MKSQPGARIPVWRDVTANVAALAWFVGLAIVGLSVLDAVSLSGAPPSAQAASSTRIAVIVGVSVMVGTSWAAWKLTSLTGVRVLGGLQLGVSVILLALVLIDAVGGSSRSA